MTELETLKAEAARLPWTTQRVWTEATKLGAGAAGLLMLQNLLWAFQVGHRPLHSLIGPDPRAFVAAQLIAAALAAGLAVLILTRRGLWACEAVLLWSLVELYPPLTRDLYGHSPTAFRFSAVAAILAIISVRGAWAIRGEPKETAGERRGAGPPPP
jgi:hypothetical protein